MSDKKYPEKKLLEKIETYKDYAVELQRGLTAIPALDPASGGTGELDKAEWLETELRKLKFDEIRRIDAPQAEAKGGVRPNIVARYKGENANRTLWIMTHLDVVPPGDLGLWKTDPYKLHIDGNKLYGRGTEDNQQGLVASILCVRALMELGVRPNVDIALLFNADEETGSEYGAHYVVKKHPDIFGKNDMFIVPDGGMPDATMIEIAEKSLLWMKVRTRGQQCHASMPGQGKNAFRAASELVTKFGSLYKKFNKKDRLYDPPMSTFEPTKKEANVPNINTLPGDDVFYMDCRVLPDYPLAQVKEEMSRLAKEVEAKHGVTVTFEPQQEAEAAPPTPADAEIVKLVAKAVKKIHKAKAKPMGIGGGTVAAAFRAINLPAVVYAKQDEVAHQPNEYCILDNLIGDAKVFTLVALNA
jgi:succinyl-diaminopimelate desuccinylase